MKAEYEKILMIVAVMVVTMYALAHYGGSTAAMLGLNPVA